MYEVSTDELIAAAHTDLAIARNPLHRATLEAVARRPCSAQSRIETMARIAVRYCGDDAPTLRALVERSDVALDAARLEASPH